ncbi:MAG TPA: hypothetical protein VL899_09425 [Alphaproteobacteria bacterium]|jgi:hypothetical protein|nr:hypothetical protein [Alphaproteobacteria bacterium]
MSRLRTYATALSFGAFALALGACSTYNTATTGGFSDAALVAQTKGVPVQVDGSVGGVHGAPLATAVAAAMPTMVGGKSLQYAPCEPNTECAGDHLVWTFGPADWRPASAHPPALATNVNWFGDVRPAPNNVAVKLALFQGGTVVASTSGQVDVNNPDDPAFKALIATMTDEVLSGPDWLDDVGLP